MLWGVGGQIERFLIKWGWRVEGRTGVPSTLSHESEFAEEATKRGILLNFYPLRGEVIKV